MCFIKHVIKIFRFHYEGNNMKPYPSMTRMVFVGHRKSILGDLFPASDFSICIRRMHYIENILTKQWYVNKHTFVGNTIQQSLHLDMERNYWRSLTSIIFLLSPSMSFEISFTFSVIRCNSI